MAEEEGVTYLSAREAAAFLGVTRATLYAYVSRGRIHPVSGPGRGKRYALEELKRLRIRSDARSGHGPVAAAALQWGEPVIETALFSVQEARPTYRGRDAIALANEGLDFEAVAEGLWGVADPQPWPPCPEGDGTGALPCRPEDRPFDHLQGALLHLARRLGRGLGAGPSAELVQARALLRALPALIAQGMGWPLGGGATLAQTLAASMGAPSAAEPTLNSALILCAEHGLTPSTFTCRVVASTGADLISCLTAGAAALSGPRHGGLCARVEALMDDAARSESTARLMAGYFEMGQAPPGFGHPLYPEGDPRGAALMSLARRYGGGAELERAEALAEGMASAGHPAPSLDFGLVTLRRSLDLPMGAAEVLFALGRVAGWVAHIQEQRESGDLLRPRARYRG